MRPASMIAAVAIAAAAATSAAAITGCRRGAPVTPAALPAEQLATASGTVEAWRQPHEVRSLDAVARLYAHEPGLVVVQQGAVVQGWPAVEAMLKDRMSRASAIHVRIADLKIGPLAPDVAGAVADMTRELVDAVAGTTVTERGALTLVLRRSDDGWVIVAEHFSYRRPS